MFEAICWPAGSTLFKIDTIWLVSTVPEFANAAGRIRSLRPLAHYKKATQANGRAERYNRLMIEGTRYFLLQCDKLCIEILV